MAHEEGTAPVPGADAPADDLLAELARPGAGASASSGGCRAYASIVGDHATSDRRNALTLELRRRERAPDVTVHETLAEAQARLTELEALDDDDLDAVLVNIARISQLREAYPNYYADTGRFTEFVELAAGSRRGLSRRLTSKALGRGGDPGVRSTTWTATPGA